jgi:molybdopterin molybdotransferase
VFATGSELLPVEAALAAGQIRDSNSGMIAAMAEQSGAVPIMCGSLPDRLDAVREAMTKAAIEADLIVTTGGVSVGDFDVMSELFRSVKHECSSDQLLFDRVAMRPGSPTSAALIDGKLLIALSGNPGACFVGFELFVRPVLLRLQGVEQALPRTVKAELLTSVEKPSPHTRYVRTRLLYDPEGRLLADPLAFSKSSMMASIADAEGLAVIPSGSRGAEAGELIDVIVIP